IRLLMFRSDGGEIMPTHFLDLGLSDGLHSRRHDDNNSKTIRPQNRTKCHPTELGTPFGPHFPFPPVAAHRVLQSADSWKLCHNRERPNPDCAPVRTAGHNEVPPNY